MDELLSSLFFALKNTGRFKKVFQKKLHLSVMGISRLFLKSLCVGAMLFELAQAIAQQRVHSASFEASGILAKKNEDLIAMAIAIAPLFVKKKWKATMKRKTLFLLHVRQVVKAIWLKINQVILKIQYRVKPF